MDLIPFAQYLQTLGLGIQGKTIFVDQMPMECVGGILLRSPLEGAKIDYELPGYYKARIDMTVRAGGYDAGRAAAALVSTALTIVEKQVGNIYVKYLRPNTLPIVYQLSKGNLLEFAVEFSAVFII